MNRRCWAEIDLGAIAANARLAKRLAGPGRGLIAVVKADAYGHGMLPVARALRGEAAVFGVANVAEASALRAGLPGARVLVLGPALPWERETIVSEGFEASVSGADEARSYGVIGERLGLPARLHLAVDTGMGRMGVAEPDAAIATREIGGIGGVELVAVATHLPSADDEPEFTREQLGRFECLVGEIGNPASHSLNSAGILRFGGLGGELVRAGLMLYGVSPVPGLGENLRPALAWKARVTLARYVAPGTTISYGRTFVARAPMRVATLGVGYADGYPRSLSGRGAAVLVGGRRCPVLGRVTMDQIVVDATGVPGAEPGGEAVLLGAQGEERIGAEELAERAGTIPWEIFTGIQTRVERVYALDDPSDF